MESRIEEAAKAAACMTRQEYLTTDLERNVICYDLARLAAQDRGYTLCQNIDIDYRPDNIGAAMLKMFDDRDALLGKPREFQEHYAPRVLVN